MVEEFSLARERVFSKDLEELVWGPVQLVQNRVLTVTAIIRELNCMMRDTFIPFDE